MKWGLGSKEVAFSAFKCFYYFYYYALGFIVFEHAAFEHFFLVIHVSNKLIMVALKAQRTTT